MIQDIISEIFKHCDCDTKLTLSQINSATYRMSAWHVASPDIAIRLGDHFSLARSSLQLVSAVYRTPSLRIMRWYMNRYPEFDHAKCLRYACFYGHMDIVQAIADIEHGVNWNRCLYKACKGGHISIIEFTIMKGANNWNTGLYGACMRGNPKIIKMLISCGADNWNLGLRGACRGGHYKVAMFMIHKGATDYNASLLGACLKGHIHLAKLMIKHGATDYNTGLLNSVYGNHINMVKFMIKCGADNLNVGLDTACFIDRLDVVKFLIKRGATDISSGFTNACLGGHIHIIEYLLGFNIDISYGLVVSGSRGNAAIVDLLIQQPHTKVVRYQTLFTAYKLDYLDVVKTIIARYPLARADQSALLSISHKYVSNNVFEYIIGLDINLEPDHYTCPVLMALLSQYIN